MTRPIVLHLVYNLIRGGTEGQCARVAMGLARRGEGQRVAVFRREGFFLPEVEQVCGEVFHLGIEHMLAPGTVRELARFRRFIRSANVGILHAWDADACIFGALAAAWTCRPLITSHRDLWEIYPRYKLFLMRRADARARSIVVNAESIRRTLPEGGRARGKSVLLRNMVDLDEFDRLSGRSWTLPLPEGIRIGYVARLHPEKDFDTFLRTAGLLRQRCPSVSFLVAGDGPEKERLRQLARSLGIDACVHFLGEVQDIPALLRNLHVGVLVPRSNEGMSNSVLEYMAARLPVVATDCGGNRELVRDGVTGYLIPPGDAGALADNLSRLVERSSQRASMGLAGRQWVETHHQMGSVLDGFQSLYRTVCP